MPYKLLLLVFVLFYVRPGSVFPIIDTLKMGTIIPLLVFIISLFMKSEVSNGEIWSHRNTKWLLFFIFLVVLSLIFKASQDTLDRLKLVVGNFFLYYSMCRIVDTKEKLKGVFAVLGFSHVILIYLNPDLILDPSTRTYVAGMTFLGDGNDFGLSLCILFPLALYLYITSDKKIPRITYITITVISVLAIVGTQSRGASLSLGCILGYLWLKSRSKVFGLIALAVLLVAAMLFASPEYFARMNTLSHYHEEGSAQGRIDAWNAAIMMAENFPILGVGAANFGDYNHNLTAHSMYFLALGELGLPGAFFIVMFMYINMRRLRKFLKELRKNEKLAESYRNLFIYVNGAFLGLAIAGAFLSALYYPHIFVVGALFFISEFLYLSDKKKIEFEESVEEENKNNNSSQKLYQYSRYN